MKRLRLTLLVGTIAGALPLAAAMAQPADAPAASQASQPALLAQADTPPVPPEVLQRKKKEIEEKVAPRGRERGGEEGGKGERPSRAERPQRPAPDEAAPQRRAAPSEDSTPSPRAERPSRGDAADEMKRRSRSIGEEAAPKPKAEAPAPRPKAAPKAEDSAEPVAPKTMKVPEEKPIASPDESKEPKARQSDREERRKRRDEDRKATDTDKSAPKAEEKTEKPAASDTDKAATPEKSTDVKAPDAKSPDEKANSDKATDKATETERQIRGTSDSNDRDRSDRNRDRADRDRGDRDRGDRSGRDRDRNARDNDIRDEADYRDRNRDFDKRFDRREERQGDRVVIKEKGDRTIIREGDRTIIRHDEDDRLRRHARDVRRERRGDEFVTIIDRPNGVQIITYSDRDGRLIRRMRREHGREIVLIDNRHRQPDYDVYVELPPLRLDIPEDEYIVEADRASYDDIRGALIAPPLAPIQQNYTLDQVRSSVSLRERVRSVDLNTINFAFGDWQVPESQVGQLENIAKALSAIIRDNPDEVFLIEGHTDAVGSEIDNLSLSDRRAEEVAAALTQDYQIPPENLVTQGYGEQYLKVDTEEANADNRRVVVRRITPLLKANAER